MHPNDITVILTDGFMARWHLENICKMYGSEMYINTNKCEIFMTKPVDFSNADLAAEIRINLHGETGVVQYKDEKGEFVHMSYATAIEMLRAAG